MNDSSEVISEGIAAAAAIAGNDDLIWEILSHLPSKSLIRFKIVCKSWMCLISNPAFIADHTRRRSSSPAISDLVLLLHRDDEATDTAFSLHDDAASLLPDPSLSFINHTIGPPDSRYSLCRIHSKIWNTCNGLLLWARDTPTGYMFWVANPTTMEMKAIPPLPITMKVRGAGVFFDPSTHPHRYRVVFFGWRIFDHIFAFATYYSERGAWGSRLETTCNLQLNVWCVFWNGMLNWVTRESLVSFDAERQLMHMAPLPFLPCGLKRLILSLHESGGRLLLIESHQTTETPNNSQQQMCFDIKAMGVERSGWSLLYHVDLAATMIGDLFPELYVVCLPSVLAVPQGEDADDNVLLLSVPGKIVEYCLRTKTLRVVREVAPTETEMMWRMLKPSDVFSYTPTLFSP